MQKPVVLPLKKYYNRLKELMQSNAYAYNVTICNVDDPAYKLMRFYDDLGKLSEKELAKWVEKHPKSRNSAKYNSWWFPLAVFYALADNNKDLAAKYTVDYIQCHGYVVKKDKNGENEAKLIKLIKSLVGTIKASGIQSYVNRLVCVKAANNTTNSSTQNTTNSSQSTVVKKPVQTQTVLAQPAPVQTTATQSVQTVGVVKDTKSINKAIQNCNPDESKSIIKHNLDKLSESHPTYIDLFLSVSDDVYNNIKMTLQHNMNANTLLLGVCEDTKAFGRGIYLYDSRRDLEKNIVKVRIKYNILFNLSNQGSVEHTICDHVSQLAKFYETPCVKASDFMSLLEEYSGYRIDAFKVILTQPSSHIEGLSYNFGYSVFLRASDVLKTVESCTLV